MRGRHDSALLPLQPPLLPQLLLPLVCLKQKG
jgi:hypothetical protein